LSQEDLEVQEFEQEKVLFVRRWHEKQEAISIFHFGGEAKTLTFPCPAGVWCKKLDTQEERWYGAGNSIPDNIMSPGEVSLTLPPQAFALLFTRKEDNGALHLHSRALLSTAAR